MARQQRRLQIAERLQGTGTLISGESETPVRYVVLVIQEYAVIRSYGGPEELEGHKAMGGSFEPTTGEFYPDPEVLVCTLILQDGRRLQVILEPQLKDLQLSLLIERARLGPPQSAWTFVATGGFD